MRDVDHDTETIHLGDDLFAEGRDTLPFPALALAGVGVAELVVAVVGERDVARAALVEFFHAAQIIAERITVLYAHERGFFAIGVNAANVRRARCYFNLFRRDRTGESVHGSEFFHCGLVSALVSRRLERVWILTFPGLTDVNDEEQRVEPAVGHVRQVELSCEALRVIALAGQVFGLEIYMGVEDEDAIMDRASSLEQNDFAGWGWCRLRV